MNNLLLRSSSSAFKIFINSKNQLPVRAVASTITGSSRSCNNNRIVSVGRNNNNALAGQNSRYYNSSSLSSSLNVTTYTNYNQAYGIKGKTSSSIIGNNNNNNTVVPSSSSVTDDDALSTSMQLLRRCFLSTVSSPLLPEQQNNNISNIIEAGDGGSSYVDSWKGMAVGSPGTGGEIAKLVRKIKADLIEADIKGNSDGKIDSIELKQILKKYPNVFNDQDINEIGELFYTSRGGEGVSHEAFIKAIANTAIDVSSSKDEENDNNDAVVTEDASIHRRKGNLSHPLGLGTCNTEYMYNKNRGVYSEEELDVKLTHVEPKTTTDKLANFAVQIVRLCFDVVSLWKVGEITQRKVLRRVVFLETVAGIPGFVAAMFRHFKSLRTFSRDGGMLNMFLDEANNERMHLLSFVRMMDPGMPMRVVVLASQAVVGVGFSLLYAISPDFCHRFVGYVEEEACHTYTTIIDKIETAPDDDEMSKWRTELAPKIARGYWHLGENGTVLDMMYAIRADEAEHRDVNHVCSGLKPGQTNPLYNPEEQFDKVLKKYVENMLERSSGYN